ncbi:MAG: DUF6062 family protein [Bacteroidota bacterium]
MNDPAEPARDKNDASDKIPFFDVEEDEIIRNKRSIPWVRLEEGLHASGCPLCEIVLKASRKHLNSLLYEYVNDVSVRKKLHASFGFCNHHSWLAKEVEHELNSDGQHLGTLHESVLHGELRLIREASEITRSTKQKPIGAKKKSADPAIQQLVKTMEPQGECLLCMSDKHTEEFYASQFVLMYSDEEFRILFEAESLLMCRPHFLSIMREAHDPAVIDYFLHQQSMKLQRLYDRLKLFLEKHDVRYQYEPHGKEWASWLETLEYFSSKPGVDRLWDHHQ